MPQQDDVYVIPEEISLDSLRPESASRKGPRPVAAATAAPAPVAAARRARAGSPAVAFTLSLFISGSGQLANGQMRLAAMFFLTQAFAVTLHWSARALWPYALKIGEIFSITETRMFAAAAAVDVAFIGMLAAGAAQAYHEAERQSGRYHGVRVAGVPALASMIVPGWGQALNGQMEKAAFFLFCGLIEAYAIVLMTLSALPRLIVSSGREDLLAPDGSALWIGTLFAIGLTWTLAIYDAMLVSGFRRHSV